MPRLEAASISITSGDPPAAISRQLAHTSARLIGRPLHAIQAARHDARRGGLTRPALAGKNVAVRDAILFNRIPQSGLDVVLIEEIVETTADDIYAR